MPGRLEVAVLQFADQDTGVSGRDARRLDAR